MSRRNSRLPREFIAPASPPLSLSRSRTRTRAHTHSLSLSLRPDAALTSITNICAAADAIMFADAGLGLFFFSSFRRDIDNLHAVNDSISQRAAGMGEGGERTGGEESDFIVGFYKLISLPVSVARENFDRIIIGIERRYHERAILKIN